MGLFSRKPKHAPAPPPSSPATEHGSPLSPPEARYANANSRRPSAASSLAPRAESPLPAIPMRAPQQHNQQPRASPASHPREHAAADDAYAGGFSQHQQYAQDQQRRRELPREPSDPATYTLPGLGLSPPSTLVPLGLGLKGSTGSSPGSPVDGYGQALGYGFPQQTGADHRSFRGAMRCVCALALLRARGRPGPQVGVSQGRAQGAAMSEPPSDPSRRRKGS